MSDPTGRRLRARPLAALALTLVAALPCGALRARGGAAPAESARRAVAWTVPTIGTYGRVAIVTAFRFDEPGVRIDLGGIAKGDAVDVAAESLRARGVRDALVDLSGNMFALGHAPGAGGWRIGIRDPRDRVPYLARLTLTNEAISTSGQCEQFVAVDGKTYGHIMDPRAGWPAQGLISVTVVSPSAMTCDGWDTPLFVLGPREARQARAVPELAWS